MLGLRNSDGDAPGATMTVKVTLPDGETDHYMRFGDTYFEHGDGSLDVIRTGAKDPYTYPADGWTEVHGDERKHKKRRFWG
jgi:hypothetical protein